MLNKEEFEMLQIKISQINRLVLVKNLRGAILQAQNVAGDLIFYMNREERNKERMSK